MKTARLAIYLMLVVTVMVLILVLSYYYGLSSSSAGLAKNNESSSSWTTLNLSNDSASSDDPKIAMYGSSIYVAWRSCSAGCEIYFRASTDGGKSFGPVISLSNGTGHSDFPQIVVSGNNVYAVWLAQAPGRYDEQVFFRASKNKGETFGPVTVLSSGGVEGADYPSIVASGSEVYVTWFGYPVPTQSHLVLRASKDNGTSFAAPIDLTQAFGVELRREFGWSPQMAAHGGNIYIAWYSDYDILFWASRDYGASFENVTHLASYRGTGWRAVDPNMLANENNLYLTWVRRTVQNNGEKDRAFFTVSSDEGRTFSDPVKLQDLQGHTDIIPAGSNIYLTWSTVDTVNNKSTIVVQRSPDQGKTVINETTKITINGRIVAPRIAASENHVYAEWMQILPDPRIGEVQFFIGPSQLFFTESTDYGASFGKITALTDGKQVVWARNMLASENKVYTVWDEGPPRQGKDSVNIEVVLGAK